MLMFKKTAVAILVFSSSAVFAGAMGPVCAPGNVTVPCEHQGWDVGGKALYLQSSWGALNFPYSQTVNNVDNFHDESTPWDWGFMLEGSYHFATGNDVNLNWYHVNDSHTSYANGLLFDTTAHAEGSGPATITTKPRWDAVNIEFGQHVDYSQAFSVRYHAGFEYVRIDFKKMASGYAPPLPYLFKVARDISYNGFGPRAGIDASYSFGNGFAAYANSAVGMYAGSSKFSYGVSPNLLPGRAGSSMLVVPELEAKVGATYTYSMAYGDISLDGGWMWINYFNPMTYGDSGEVHSANFGLQGPYLGLKWVGSLA